MNDYMIDMCGEFSCGGMGYWYWKTKDELNQKDPTDQRKKRIPLYLLSSISAQAGSLDAGACL